MVLILGFLNACKKGDEDPLFSIYSRQKRISGEWKVSEAEIKYDNHAGGDAFYEKYNKTVVTINFSDDNYNYFADGTYYWYFNINKNGTYTITKLINGVYSYNAKTIEEGVCFF